MTLFFICIIIVAIRSKKLSCRQQIPKRLAKLFNDTLNGRSPYKSNLYGRNAIDKHKFWDEVKDYPFISVVAGPETREYLPGAFKWGILNVSLKLYTYGDDCQEKLEDLISEVESLIDANQHFDFDRGATTEILISSITTDEGLLQPHGVGEINLTVRYEVQ